MPQAVLVEGLRTPFVKAGGELRHLPAQELGRQVVRELLYRLDLEPSAVDELICGNVATPSDAANIGRVIALRAGIPRNRIAHSVSRNCASGFEAVTEAVARINAGESKTVMAVGVESMSNIPLMYNKAFTEKMLAISKARNVWQKMTTAMRFRPSDLKPEIGLQQGLTDPVSGMIMGDTAEKLAREYHITREEQDQFALSSHEKALEAWEDKRLASETMTFYPAPEFHPIIRDIGPRAGQNMFALAKLKPFFDRRWGTVTVGNSCQVTDGAVAILVMEEALAKSKGLPILGRIKSAAYAGCDPARMGLGPVYASALALKAAKLKLSDMELIEINEAFAAQVLACLRAFEKPPEDCPVSNPAQLLGKVDPIKLNVNGGAIALGHPVGATGTRLILTMLHELRRRNQQVGLVSLCVGGGQGGAIILERS